MPDVTDMDLVREYCARQSEPAFETLVHRHVNLVYSTALRRVGNPAQAEEITQAVFIILASKAARLRPDAVLAAWLHETARHVSASYLRGEIRRRRREQEAYMQSILQPSSDDTAWEQLAPLLDEAIGRLGTADRDVVALRYFQNKSAQEIATALNIGEAAAKKRLTRAVEKLRRDFSKRGINVSTAALSSAVLTHSVQAAPVALAKSVTAIALAKGATASISTLTLIKGALKIMAWAKAKTAVVAGVAVLLATGTTVTLYLERQNISDWMTVKAAERAVAKHIATPIDMTGHYAQSASLLEGSSSYWGEVPWEFQVFHDVPLQIDGIIYLWGRGNAQAGAVYPDAVTGIAVNLKFDTLYVYHCTFNNSPKYTPVYDLVFRYEDGVSATNTIQYGVDTMDFNTPGGKAIKDIKGPSGHNTKIGWIGSSFSADGKHPLLFSLTAMKNPRPSVNVASIDLFSSKNQSSGVVLAMTAGPADMMK